MISMESASISNIKNEAATLSKDQLVALVLRLTKHKKENKELTSYLLFYRDDENSFVTDAKQEISELFSEVNRHHPYLAKKTLRKILRLIAMYNKFTTHKTTQVELLLHYCTLFRQLPAVIRQSNVLYNTYLRHLEKLQKMLLLLHEDVQWDYKEALEQLR
jgi:hypothetical protein